MNFISMNSMLHGSRSVYIRTLLLLKVSFWIEGPASAPPASHWEERERRELLPSQIDLSCSRWSLPWDASAHPPVQAGAALRSQALQNEINNFSVSISVSLRKAWLIRLELTLSFMHMHTNTHARIHTHTHTLFGLSPLLWLPLAACVQN